jgi:hypothetical protein
MTAMYPMGPITDGGGLNITVMSYMGTMFFGLMACRETVPGVWDIAHNIQSGLEELKKAADQASAAATPKAAVKADPKPKKAPAKAAKTS